jgi:hypothetical protein
MLKRRPRSLNNNFLLIIGNFIWRCFVKSSKYLDSFHLSTAKIWAKNDIKRIVCNWNLKLMGLNALKFKINGPERLKKRHSGPIFLAWMNDGHCAENSNGSFLTWMFFFVPRWRIANKFQPLTVDSMLHVILFWTGESEFSVFTEHPGIL